jgi:hypothetical protein
LIKRCSAKRMGQISQFRHFSFKPHTVCTKDKQTGWTVHQVTETMNESLEYWGEAEAPFPER